VWKRINRTKIKKLLRKKSNLNTAVIFPDEGLFSPFKHLPHPKLRDLRNLR
jgi:hypothetical protein